MSSEADGIIIRRAEPDDAKRVREFLRQVYRPGSAQHDEVRWQWLFGDHDPPLGRVCDVYLALTPEQDIMGHVGLLPLQVAVHGEQHSAAWAFNLIVSPAHRRRGVSSALFRYVASRHERLIGVGPTDRGRAFLTALGWTEMGALVRYSRVLHWPSYLAWRMRMRLGRWKDAPAYARDVPPATEVHTHQGGVTTLHRFDDSADALWERLLPRFGFIAERTARLLNWRFVDRPGAGYRLLGLLRGGLLEGWCVCATALWHGFRRGYIVDMLYDPRQGDTGEVLLAAAVAQLRHQQAMTAEMATTFAPLQRLLRQVGFRSRGPDKLVHCPAWLRELELSQWLLTRGDAMLDDELFYGFRAHDDADPQSPEGAS